MLDNYTPAALKEVAGRLKAEWPFVTIEASGGITWSGAACTASAT